MEPGEPEARKPPAGDAPDPEEQVGPGEEPWGASGSSAGRLRDALGRRADEVEPAAPEPEAATANGERQGWFRKKLALRRSLGVQIAAGLVAAIAFTLLVSVVALVVFFRVATLQEEINNEHVPALTRAAQIGQLAARLAGSAPRLVTAARNRQLAADALARTAAAGDTGEVSLMEDAARILELSSDLGSGERPQGLRAFSEDLASNLRDIQVSVDAGVVLLEELQAIQERAAILGARLNEQVAPPLDDQVFYLVTGLRELDDSPAPIAVRSAEHEVIRLEALSVLESKGNLAVSLLNDVAVQDDLEFVGTLEERFRAATTASASALATLGEQAPSGLGDTVRAIGTLGLGGEGAFPTRRRYLVELRNQLAYLARNEEITNSLEDAVSSLTIGLEMDALAATRDSESAFDVGRSLLVAINVVAVASTALILWLFVGRFLVARLSNLSRAMRRMAAGDLETGIEVRGRDEVGEMAGALEVFRRHALEVQRLNLVEELATRVEAKNQELGEALEGLKKAQEQVVMQEKLASLGQLTAGIAHEIKNPLNFVNNFADISQSLLEDLQEELESVVENIPEESQEEIREIRNDLTGNLERIVHHGKRASSIVYGMLEHARKEGGERRPTEINAMVEEYIALAFHAMRAEDNRFQMTIRKDLADDVGSVDAVPQDLSRVFLNIVTNACHATFQKQISEESEPDYEPALEVASSRENGMVEVRIRDNGPGIPEDHLSRIFEPFFTTKDQETGTGRKGTGLGLSLSHDIVRAHGGTLAVSSETGKGAEFVIRLPVRSSSPQPSASAAAAPEEVSPGPAGEAATASETA